jgi:predicted DNA binding CopG/RHH family protein
MKDEKGSLQEISAEEFDRRFDNGEDISQYVDWDAAEHINIKPRVVNVNFPAWMVNALDQEAAIMGITRQSLIKVVLHDHIRAKSASMKIAGEGIVPSAST